MDIHETIIIGAGISGLACARTLHRKKKPFIIITEDIGGRIRTSKDGNCNYGAYYVREDYNHVLKYVRKEKEIDRTNLLFIRDGQSYKMPSRMGHYPWQVERSYLIIEMFRREYKKFKINAEHMSQKEAIESNPRLNMFFNQRASDFIREHEIKDFSKDYLEQILHASILSSPSKTNAFNFLQLMMVFCLSIYTFTFLKDKMIAPFKSKIFIDSVTKVKKKKDVYLLKTKKGKTYYAKNVVVATPTNVSKKLLNIRHSWASINMNAFHIQGILKNEGNRNNPPMMFPVKSPTYTIQPQEDGTFLFYSIKSKPNFGHYFKDYEIIEKISWNSVYNSNLGPPVECRQGENLYMIGDYNVWSLEDAYITGIYTANQIAKNTSAD
jgi:glycine/D-amino acid oxidase-like deaminating enzyme